MNEMESPVAPRYLLERLVRPRAQPPHAPPIAFGDPPKPFSRDFVSGAKLLAYGGEVQALDLPELLDRAQPLTHPAPCKPCSPC